MTKAAFNKIAVGLAEALAVAHDDPEQYLDSSAYIRKLEEAERVHQLDQEAVLGKLGEAAKACEGAAERHGVVAYKFLVAKAIYLAEAKRRVGFSPGGHAKERLGLGFRGWCGSHKIGYGYAWHLAAAGASENPEQAVIAYRKEINRKNLEMYYRKQKIVRESKEKSKEKSAPNQADPLSPGKRFWHGLSPVQKIAFASWIRQQDQWMKAAAD